MTSNPPMTSQTEARARLEPCPFCAKPLFVRVGPHPYARCDTDGCWMHERKMTVQLDVPSQVAGWNVRPKTPATVEVESKPWHKVIGTEWDRLPFPLEADNAFDTWWTNQADARVHANNGGAAQSFKAGWLAAKAHTAALRPTVASPAVTVERVAEVIRENVVARHEVDSVMRAYTFVDHIDEAAQAILTLISEGR